MENVRLVDVITVVAILLGPILAVQAQTFLERRRQKRETRLKVYRALMATRATKVAPNHVEALNLITIDFYGEKAVLRAWDSYIDHLNAPVQADHAWLERTNDLFLSMMEEMGKSLGYDFPKSQIKREGYISKAQADIESDFGAIRKGLVEVLAGNTSIPIRAAGGPSVDMTQAHHPHPHATSLPWPPGAKPGEKL